MTDSQTPSLDRSGVRKFKSGIGVSLAQPGATAGTPRQGTVVRCQCQPPSVMFLHDSVAVLTVPDGAADTWLRCSSDAACSSVSPLDCCHPAAQGTIYQATGDKPALTQA